MFLYLRFVCVCFLNDPSFAAHYDRYHSVPLLTSTGLAPVRRKTVNPSAQSRDHNEEPNGNDKQHHRHSLDRLGKPSLFSSKVALRFSVTETLRSVIAAIAVTVVAQGLLGVVSRQLHRIGIVMIILWANQAPTTLE